MPFKNVTRGFGVLEKFLSIQRMIIAQKLIKKYKKSGKILDIGCGTYPLFLINTNFEEKFGIDQEIKNMEVKLLNLHLKKSNIRSNLKFPFKENYFDVITMLAFIEHLGTKQLERILKKSYSLLKKDGVLIITTPASWSDIPLKIMAKLRLVSPEEIHEHKNLYSLKELNNSLIKANFKQTDVKSGYFEFFLNLWCCARK